MTSKVVIDKSSKNIIKLDVNRIIKFTSLENVAQKPASRNEGSTFQQTSLVNLTSKSHVFSKGHTKSSSSPLVDDTLVESRDSIIFKDKHETEVNNVTTSTNFESVESYNRVEIIFRTEEINSVPDYLCNNCDYSTADENEYGDHLTKHSFKCDLCQFYSETRISLLRHIKINHPITAEIALNSYLLKQIGQESFKPANEFISNRSNLNTCSFTNRSISCPDNIGAIPVSKLVLNNIEHSLYNLQSCDNDRIYSGGDNTQKTRMSHTTSNYDFQPNNDLVSTFTSNKTSTMIVANPAKETRTVIILECRKCSQRFTNPMTAEKHAWEKHGVNFDLVDFKMEEHKYSVNMAF